MSFHLPFYYPDLADKGQSHRKGIYEWSYIEQLDKFSKPKRSSKEQVDRAKHANRNLLQDFDKITKEQGFKFETLTEHMRSINHHPRKDINRDMADRNLYFFIDTNILILHLIILKDILKRTNNNCTIMVPYTAYNELISQLSKYSSDNLLNASKWLDNNKTSSSVHIQSEEEHIKACKITDVCPDWHDRCGDAACESSDNKILSFCLHSMHTRPNSDVVLVTKDINLQLKAKINGVRCYQEFQTILSAQDRRRYRSW